MTDVGADLREAIRRVLGPLELDTLTEQVSDYHLIVAARDEATKRLANSTNDTDRSRLYGVRSLTQRLLRDLDAAEHDAVESLTHAEKVGTTLLKAPARVRLAQVHRVKGDYPKADQMFALAEIGELPKHLTGRILALAALSCIGQDRLTEALIHLEDAVETTPDPVTAAFAQPAIEIIYQRAPAGFGPLPRTWHERAQFPCPIRFKDPRTSLWGYMGADRRPIIEPKYQEAGEFRDGIAAVKSTMWGAINPQGEQVVPFLWDRLKTALPHGRSVTGFVDNAAVIDRRGTKGVINRGGKVIVPPHHREVIVHPAGFAVSRDGMHWGARDYHGDELIPSQFDKREVLRRMDAHITIDDGPL